MASMAWVRLSRTWARCVATAGVTEPPATQVLPSPMPTPSTCASWYSRQALKSMSSAPSCSRTRRAGWSHQVGGGQLVGQIAGLLRRHRALAVPGGVVDAVGHGAADRQLITDEVTVRRAHGHGEPEVRAPPWSDRPAWTAPGRQRRSAARSGASGRGWPVRARRGPSPRARRPGWWGVAPGAGGTAGGPALRVTSTMPPATRARTTTAASTWTRRERRAAAPQVCSLPINGPLESLHRRQRRCDLTGCFQPGGSRTRQPLWPPKPKEFERTAVGSQGSGSPCTIGIVISGSGSA